MTTLPRFKLPSGLAAYRAGSGPTLLLLHGVGLRSEAWVPLLPMLEPDFDVIAIDMPGHGESPFNDVSSLDDYVAPIVELAASFGAPVFVAGHSMGALIAITAAAKEPSNIAGLAALNAVYDRTPEAAIAIQARAAELAANPLPDPGPTLIRWFGDQGNHAQHATACRDWLTNCDQTAYAAAYGVFANHDGARKSDLAALTMPSLFITGADEPNSTPAMSHEMAKIAPHGHAKIIEGAAHMGPMTHPIDYAKAIKNCFGKAGHDG